MRSESIRAGPSDADTDFETKFGFEVAAGRSIYTTQSWSKALQYCIPFFWDGVGVQARMVLLTMAPGGSQQELGTIFQLCPAKPSGEKCSSREMANDPIQTVPSGNA